MKLRLCFALACLSALQLAAQEPGAGFAAIAVADSQSLRINVLNEALPVVPSAARQDSAVTADCRVVLQFYGSGGQLLKERIVDNLAPGTIAFLDFTPADRPTNELRTPVRAVARFGYVGGANPSGEVVSACRVLPSVEVFEAATGKTQILVTDARALPTPDPRRIP